MTFAIVLLCTIAACLILRKPIKRYPLLFYGLAVVVCIIFFVSDPLVVPRSVWLVFLMLIQKCMLPLALFVVVMYIGVFPSNSKPYHWLKPIRAELSIIACILALGHMVVYLQSYLPRILSGGSFGTNVMASFVISLVLFFLLLILGITSFQAVKTRMSVETWKKIQKWAYVFFFLVYVHMVLMLLPSALNGGIASVVTVGVYSIVFGVYAVLRGVRAVSDKKASEDDR